MKRHDLLVLLLCFIVSSGLIRVHSVSYDYSYTAECLARPLAPQYEGGIVKNPKMDCGVEGWNAIGNAKLAHKESGDGNKYLVVYGRNGAGDSLAQKFQLNKDKLYVLSAWLQVSKGDAHIAAVFRTREGYQPPPAGWVIARQGCWSMLKGGIVVNASGPADLYFTSNNQEVEIWVDNISLKPFSQEEWKSHQNKSIEKTRKSNVKFQVINHLGRPLRNAKIVFKQLKMDFPFGNAISKYIIDNKAYQDWFASKFKYTVFENEMKWYATEKRPGMENYTVPDTMLQYAENHNVTIRGHNIFWDDPKYTPSWVKMLTPKQLSVATENRLNSLVKRYLGKVIHWDINNENLHFSFYENMLGENASSVFFQRIHEIDGKVIPFLNDYNTIEVPEDSESTPAKYIEKIRLIRKQGYKGPMGIGLEGHFFQPNLPYVRASIDMFAALKLPIWITELDVFPSHNEAEYLEELIRELHSHPAIEGIIMWASWRPQGCWRMCLTDDKFKNLPTGDAVDKILNEWTHQGLVGKTDENGFFKTSLFHGEYQVTVTYPLRVNFPVSRKIKVSSEHLAHTIRIEV